MLGWREFREPQDVGQDGPWRLHYQGGRKVGSLRGWGGVGRGLPWLLTRPEAFLLAPCLPVLPAEPKAACPLHHPPPPGRPWLRPVESSCGAAMTLASGPLSPEWLSPPPASCCILYPLHLLPYPLALPRLAPHPHGPPSSGGQCRGPFPAQGRWDGIGARAQGSDSLGLGSDRTLVSSSLK